MFLVEPVMGFGGVIVPPPEYFDIVTAICRDYEVLLAVDEVTTGYGRTGKMFASEHWDLQPDIMALGKAMSGGYFPLGATVATDELWERFVGPDNSTRFDHGSTNSGHPGACAAGRATLELFRREGYVEKVQKRGEFFLARLQQLNELPIVGDVRGLGMFFAIEFVADKQTRQPLANEWMTKLAAACYVSGLWVHLSGNRVILLPPFILDEDELEQAYRGLRKVFTMAAKWM